MFLFVDVCVYSIVIFKHVNVSESCIVSKMYSKKKIINIENSGDVLNIKIRIFKFIINKLIFQFLYSII